MFVSSAELEGVDAGSFSVSADRTSLPSSTSPLFFFALPKVYHFVQEVISRREK